MLGPRSGRGSGSSTGAAGFGSATQVLLGSYVLLFLIPLLAKLGRPETSFTSYLMRGDDLAMLRMGANWAPLLERGQLWRLVTATFLHAGAIHLFFNGYALNLLGHGLEKLYGWGWFLLFMVVFGVAGNVLSWQVHGQGFANVGASGSIFGLIGLGIAHCWRTRWVNRRLLNMLVQWAVIGFAFGLMARIDNWAHLGGFLAGGLAGVLLPAEAARSRVGRRIGMAAGGLGLLTALLCFLFALLQGS